MDRVEPPTGYVLTSKDVKEILAIEAGLLRTEGIDPAWPGFAETTERPESPAISLGATLPGSQA